MSRKSSIFAGNMEQKGLTKNQFRIQMGMVAFWELYALYWLVTGILEKSTFKWIMGAVFCLLYIVYAVYLIIERKRHPLENPQLDKQAADDFKTGLKGMGIVFAFITVGFLIAIGLAAALK